MPLLGASTLRGRLLHEEVKDGRMRERKQARHLNNGQACAGIGARFALNMDIHCYIYVREVISLWRPRQSQRQPSCPI